MLDFYNSAENKDDKLALMYQLNQDNLVAVNTPVGQTERVIMNNIIMQGSTPAPLQCSNSVDLLGKLSYQRHEYLYKYKNSVNLSVLGATDDLLGAAVCGKKSLDLNIFVTTQIELKQLKFHTPDKNGKSKCHVMHIGRSDVPCQKLKVHGQAMTFVDSEMYLGDKINRFGKNGPNIEMRVSKGIGLVA